MIVSTHVPKQNGELHKCGATKLKENIHVTHDFGTFALIIEQRDSFSPVPSHHFRQHDVASCVILTSTTEICCFWIIKIDHLTLIHQKVYNFAQKSRIVSKHLYYV